MLSKNIIRLRKSKGLTQVDFAKQLHVTQSAVSHWESGRSIPDTVQLFRIAEFFGVTVEELSQMKSPDSDPLKIVRANIDMGFAETKTAPAERRAEAKMLLEAMSDEQYQAALQYLKFLQSQEEKK